MKNDTGKKTIYQIKVSGSLDQRWTEWFHKMQITTEINEGRTPITVLTGPVIDQVALRGLMTKIWDLNFELISAQRMEDWMDSLGGNPDENDD